jgi:DNA-directed RNA polymerase specialized sigma24 family protein
VGVRLTGGAVEGEAQFRALYEQHQPDVLAYFLRRLDRDDAVEATADVFLAVWNGLDTVPTGSEGRLWLFGMARNTLRNRQRTNRRLHRLAARLATVPWSDPDPLSEIVVVRRAEDRETLRLSVGCLLGLFPEERPYEIWIAQAPQPSPNVSRGRGNGPSDCFCEPSTASTPTGRRCPRSSPNTAGGQPSQRSRRRTLPMSALRR